MRRLSAFCMLIAVSLASFGQMEKMLTNLVSVPNVKQLAIRYNPSLVPKNIYGHDQMPPLFLVYPDSKLDEAAYKSLIMELGLLDYVNNNAGNFIISGPVGQDYDAKADLDAFIALFNEVRIVSNLKVIGIGRGATFVNTALVQNGSHIAGIATYGGKAVRQKSLLPSTNGKVSPVPAFIQGKDSRKNGANYIKVNNASLSGTQDGCEIYENGQEELQRVVIDPRENMSLSEFMKNAWDMLLSRNYRLNNIDHTWYNGCSYDEHGEYELEPYVDYDRLKVTRKVQQRQVGTLGKLLWYEYYPEGTGADAKKGSIPVMVLLHGNTNDPRTQAETSGFVELSAKEKFAVIELEWQGSRMFDAMRLDGIDEVIGLILSENPQLDASKVYAEGLSAGSYTGSSLGLHSPYVFAAVGGHSGGINPPGGRIRFGLSYEMMMRNARQKAGRVLMPYCSVCGVVDDVVPYPKRGDYRQSSIYNAWKIYQTLNGLEVRDSLDFDVDETFGQKLDDRHHVDTNKNISMEVAEQRNRAGIPLIKFIAVNHYAHWNFKPVAKLMWDYYSQFSRNLETGELEYRKK